MSHRAFIENLSYDQTVEDLRKNISDLAVEWILIEQDDQGRYAYVGFSSEEDALRAVNRAINDDAGVGADGEPLRIRLVDSGPDQYADKTAILRSEPEHIFSQSRLLIEDAPPNAEVRLNNIEIGAINEDGYLNVANLLPGRYLLTVITNRKKIAFNQDVTVFAGKPTEIHVIGGKSSGALLLRDFLAQNRPKNRSAWPLLLLVAAVSATAAAFWFYRSSEKPAPPKIPTAPPGMVYIPSGRFVMGRNSADPFESPPHAVEVSQYFFLDRTEVTNAEYAKFVRAAGYKPPPHWGAPQPPTEIADLPVVNVSWRDAASYCEWRNLQGRSCRLPTEMEWEFAARGTDGLLYPWGNEWRDKMANANRINPGPVAAGAYATSASRRGALDMIGNVWEWTADDLEVYPLSRAEPQPGVKVIRGGAFDSPPEKASGSFRGFLKPDSTEYDRTGFRCACDPNDF